jgi:hypothetical protein
MNKNSAIALLQSLPADAEFGMTLNFTEAGNPEDPGEGEGNTVRFLTLTAERAKVVRIPNAEGHIIGYLKKGDKVQTGEWVKDPQGYGWMASVAVANFPGMEEDFGWVLYREDKFAVTYEEV